MPTSLFKLLTLTIFPTLLSTIDSSQESFFCKTLVSEPKNKCCIWKPYAVSSLTQTLHTLHEQDIPLVPWKASLCHGHCSWLGISLTVEGDDCFCRPLLFVCSFPPFFIQLLHSLYLDPQVFLVLVFLFSPLSCWRREEWESAWLIAGANPPQ